jgi:large subunit ribosomal protein L9
VMKIILMEDSVKLGERGAVVDVKDGYARNFLIPQGIALEATDANMKVYEQHKVKVERLNARKKSGAQELQKELQKISLTIPQQAKEDEELFGSVTAADIVAALAKENRQVAKEAIMLDEPIRKLGVYPVKVRLHPEVEAEIKVWVVKK